MNHISLELDCNLKSSESLVEFAFTALQKDSAALRGAAIYTIGQFAEHNLIIDDLTEYFPKILEKITKILQQPTQDIIPHLQDSDPYQSIGFGKKWFLDPSFSWNADYTA